MRRLILFPRITLPLAGLVALLCIIGLPHLSQPVELQLNLASFTQSPLPVPAPADVASAKKVLAEIYREEFTQANDRNQTRKLPLLKELSEKIVAVASTETDPNRLYAIFDVAIEIGKLSGDFEHTSKLINQFQTRFAIDAHQMHSEVAEYCLAQIPKQYKTLSEQRPAYTKLGDDLKSLATTAAQSSQWTNAQRFYELSARCYKKTSDPSQASKVDQLARDMKKRSVNQVRIDQLQADLTTSNDKPKLHLEIGIFYCFEVGDWQSGLPHLRDSSDQAMAAAASADLSSNESSWESSGDLWWDLSQEPARKPYATALLKRALTQYSLALKSAKGLAQAKITKRMQTAGASADDIHALSGKAAVSPTLERGLKWLAKQQLSNGSWSLTGPYRDGGASEDSTAATAMALLVFLRAGHGPQAGAYKQNVKSGLTYLLTKQNKEGYFATGEPAHNQAYSQALASLAVLEAYLLTRDAKYRTPVNQALKYAQWSQGKLGGWRYTPRDDSDTSVTGWYVLLLTRAKEANIDVSDDVLKKANAYLDSVNLEGSSRYSYMPHQPATLAMTSEALRCRLELGMSRDHPQLLRAVKDDLLPNVPQADASSISVYYYLHATHVMQSIGGQSWTDWRTALTQTIDTLQEPAGVDGGSWSPDKDQFGPSGGRLYVTCFLLYCLQVADQFP